MNFLYLRNPNHLFDFKGKPALVVPFGQWQAKGFHVWNYVSLTCQRPTGTIVAITPTANPHLIGRYKPQIVSSVWVIAS